MYNARDLSLLHGLLYAPSVWIRCLRLLGAGLHLVHLLSDCALGNVYIESPGNRQYSRSVCAYLSQIRQVSPAAIKLAVERVSINASVSSV